MRGLKVAALAILALFPCSGYAVVTDGNEWRTLSPGVQSAYLTGYVEAIASCSAFATPKLNGRPEIENNACRLLVGVDDNKAIALVTRVTQEQLRDALNQFYADATVRLISVPRALGIIFMRLTGAPERDLAEMIEFERALAARTQRPR
jgi:hypothetical protein